MYFLATTRYLPLLLSHKCTKLSVRPNKLVHNTADETGQMLGIILIGGLESIRVLSTRISTVTRKRDSLTITMPIPIEVSYKQAQTVRTRLMKPLYPQV